MLVLLYQAWQKFQQKLEQENRRVRSYIIAFEQLGLYGQVIVLVKMWQSILRQNTNDHNEEKGLYKLATLVAWHSVRRFHWANPASISPLFLIGVRFVLTGLTVLQPIFGNKLDKLVSLFYHTAKHRRTKNSRVLSFIILVVTAYLLTTSLHTIGGGLFADMQLIQLSLGRPIGGGPLKSTAAANILFWLESAIISLCFLGVVAFYTLLERKGIAAVQRREGPNTTGPFGILQPIADGAKLVFKDVTASDEADAEAYDLAPVITFGISFTGWALLPVGLTVGSLVASDYTIVLFLCVVTLSIFGVVGAGWATKSKYATLGSLRALAQFIAYEVYFSLLLVPFFIYTGPSFLAAWERQSVLPYFIPFLPLFILFFITMLVETNRAPFDLPEAEAELVAGFNVEYSASAFALYFLGEYNSMIVASALMTLLFFGGDVVWASSLSTVSFSWPVCYVIKTLLLCFSFVFVRANFPRVRFDQLLLLGWKVCLPVSLSAVWTTILAKTVA